MKGIGFRNLEMSFNLLYDNRWTGWISAVTTHGTGRLTIPATGHVGDHVIEVLHGQFGFPYRNQEQSPEPDRPRFSIPFTVTAGAPVLPPAPAAQAQTHVRLPARSATCIRTPRFSGVGEPVTVTRGCSSRRGRRYTLNWTRVIGNRIDGGGWENPVDCRGRGGGGCRGARAPLPSTRRTISAAPTGSGSTPAAGAASARTS